MSHSHHHVFSLGSSRLIIVRDINQALKNYVSTTLLLEIGALIEGGASQVLVLQKPSSCTHSPQLPLRQ